MKLRRWWQLAAVGAVFAIAGTVVSAVDDPWHTGLTAGIGAVVSLYVLGVGNNDGG